MSWWQRLRHRDRLEGELDRELRDHVERQVAEHVRAGLPEREARRRARLEFGGLDQVKETCRDARGVRWIEDIVRDVRYALRRQFKDRHSGVSAIAIAALAIGIGASTAMFSVLDAVVLEPLPFPQQERLVVGWKTSRTDPARFIELSYPEFLAWHAQSTSFEGLAALPTTVYGYSYVLTGRGEPVTIESTRVTSEFFDVLGVQPLLGRTFTAADDREGAQPTVVLTHAFWTSVLGADPGVTGSGLTLGGVDFTVIGVLPAGLVFPRGVDVFTALGTRPGLANNRTVFLQVLGRLRPGVSRRQASSELDGIVSRLEAQRPGSIGADQAATLAPLRDHILGSGQLIAGCCSPGRSCCLWSPPSIWAACWPRARRAAAARWRCVSASAHRLAISCGSSQAEGLVLATIGTILRRALAEVDPEQPMSADLTTTELVERALSRERFQSALLLPFGLGSALLAAIGVFGIVSDAANRRLRELALRQALGATRSQLLLPLLRSTLVCVLVGECLGLGVAIAAGKALNLALFEISVVNPGIIITVCSLILGAALVACIAPAARVLRLEPGAVLRQ